MCCAKIITSVVNINGLLRLYNLDAFHIFFKEDQNSLQRMGDVGIRHRWFLFSPSSGEYVLLHPDFPLSPHPSFLHSFLSSIYRRSDTFWLISFPHLCCWVVKAANNLGWMRTRSFTNLFALNDKQDLIVTLSQEVWVQLGVINDPKITLVQLYLEKTC